MIPASASVPMPKVMKVIGMMCRKPPILRISNVLVAWLTEPEPRKSSALKKACVIRWKTAAA